MDTLTLTYWQRRRLEQQLRSTHDARVYRRTLAVLEVASGQAVGSVAGRLRVTPRAVYHWLAAYYDAQMLWPERFTLAVLEDARRVAEEGGGGITKAKSAQIECLERERLLCGVKGRGRKEFEAALERPTGGFDVSV